jgi:hypothetical protein
MDNYVEVVCDIYQFDRYKTKVNQAPLKHHEGWMVTNHD